MKRTSLIYPQKGKSADEAIKQKMSELKQIIPADYLKNIIIITGDRMLVQECYLIHELRRSSGLYFIKFLKKYIKKESKYDQSLKKINKRILNYGK